MIIPPEIKEFLKKAKDLSIGYSELSFLTIKELEDPVIESAFQLINTSLSEEQEKEWPAHWFLIAFDELGDPVCVDLSSAGKVVLSVPPEGIGEAYVIAESLNNLHSILTRLRMVAKKRTSPVELEANPIPSQERQEVLETILRQNPKAASHFWEGFLDNHDD